jgi:hypothetical protein
MILLECDTCQCNKGETAKPLSTLQQLMLPPTICMDISMYFIVGLPKSRDKLVIMVVVDHLSKYAPFFALQNLFRTSMVAQFFIDNISSKSMECLILLYLTMIPLLLTIFGKNYSSSMELN